MSHNSFDDYYKEVKKHISPLLRLDVILLKLNLYEGCVLPYF
jgi:hypothetical protein